jgi:hypothetical protein
VFESLSKFYFLFLFIYKKKKLNNIFFFIFKNIFFINIITFLSICIKVKLNLFKNLFLENHLIYFIEFLLSFDSFFFLNNLNYEEYYKIELKLNSTLYLLNTFIFYNFRA